MDGGKIGGYDFWGNEILVKVLQESKNIMDRNSYGKVHK